MSCLYSNHIHPDARLRDPNEATTDGFVSRGMLEAITSLPKEAQTSLLKFLVRIDPLDEIVGDILISAVLAFGACKGVRTASKKTLKKVAETASSISPTDVTSTCYERLPMRQVTFMRLS